MKAEELKKREPKYWICDDCAEKQNLTAPEWAVTMISGLCGHCARPDKAMLTPVCDFGGKRVGAIWD